MSKDVLEKTNRTETRTSDEQIEWHSVRLRTNKTLTTILDAMPHQVAVLDKNRQIIAINSSLLESFDSREIEDMLGARPGELLGCKNSSVGPSGCGTSEACGHCGAVNAILVSQTGTEPVTKPCQVTIKDSGESLDLKVTASPLHIDGQELTVLSIQDMADENRRKVLERTFFHDVLNAAGGALGLAQELTEMESIDEAHEYAHLLVLITEQITAEIISQQEMMAAERGELNVQKEDFGTIQFLMEVLNTYSEHTVAEGRTLELAGTAQDRLVHTSKTLLHRVLGNMVKNALEATDPGGIVRLGCSHEAGEYCFWVNNPQVMPRSVQLQIFNRSFSTKGTGRGIGTYSIRLLGEQYLGGRVSFDSNEARGTTFRIHLPAH